MARPMKTGLDYYPMDVGFLRDKKVRLLRSEFGASSVLFVLYVLGKVYEGDGYFLAWDKDECLLAADELRESPAYISEVLQGCLSRSLFDERVFQVSGVLTSAGIQRRYLRSCEKRDVISISGEYWLLDMDDKKDVPAGIRAKLTLFSVSGGKNQVNSPGNPVDSPGNPESKVKESKVKESKEGACAPCAEPEPVSAAPPVIFLPLKDGTSYLVTEEQLNGWIPLYPGIDVMQKLQKMKAWLENNPMKRKTRRGILRFITGWLDRDQKEAEARPYSSTRSSGDIFREMLRKEKNRQNGQN